ncbi:MAG: hypothetical protein CMM02_18235 [Rhodopirellula sp.]|nr:hypothetical protein [Rhodopirellula sp.]|tara:strand:+ start:397 stop:960 length:564 start_codon:yes stop_codon:yes gene_type:complete
MSKKRTNLYEIYDMGKYRPKFNCVVVFNNIHEPNTPDDFAKVLRDTADQLERMNHAEGSCVIRDKKGKCRGLWSVSALDDGFEQAQNMGHYEKMDLPKLFESDMTSEQLEKHKQWKESLRLYRKVVLKDDVLYEQEDKSFSGDKYWVQTEAALSQHFDDYEIEYYKGPRELRANGHKEFLKGSDDEM